MKRLVSRRWGHYKVLHEGPQYVVKELVVRSNSGISYQKHSERAEFWYVKSGSGVIKYAPLYAPRSESYVVVKESSTFLVKQNTWHQVWNEHKEPLVILEMQVGNCSEEDIVRLSYFEGDKEC
jgi:mannose-6-phosphate isomerase-like protein (cupin superfamily)